MNTNENDSGTLKFSKPTPNFPKGGEEIKDGEFVSPVKEETKVKHPDFNEWILTEEGKKCNDFSSLTGRAYLQNRLFWAFDAGRNCIWDQFQETKKENQELKALLEPFRKLANSVLTEREVLPSENEWNRPLYSFNLSDITYNDLRRILDHFKSKAQ